jgi:MFS family permease
VLVPTLVVLVADNYQGDQQAKALGWLGGAPAMGIVLAFLLAGSLTTWIGWRFMFGLLAGLSVFIYKLSGRLNDSSPASHVVIDVIGAVLAALAILFISVGSSNLTAWGVLLAGPAAPFAILDMSPAPLMILSGIFLLQAFISWSRRRRDAGEATLVSLDVIGSAAERAALFSILIISALASAITFLLPLYLQVVQGRSSFDTAVTVIPFSIASFIAAVLVVRLHGRVSPHRIARFCFLLVAAGLTLLGATIRNDWSDSMVVLGMIVAGIGEGALVTLLFNVLVTASPKELAADVGSVRGATNNLATAVGTALAGALLIGLLETGVHYDLVHNPRIPHVLRGEVNLDDVQFVSNDRLRRVMARTSATAEQVEEAVRINTDARLLSLKLTFFAFAGLALLAYFPAGALPSYARSELPRGARDLAHDTEQTAASSPA